MMSYRYGFVTGSWLVRQQAQAFGGRAVVQHMAILEAHQPLAVGGDVRLVRDQQDGDAALLVQLLERAHDLLAGLRIEVAGRLVGQHQRRIAHQRAGDRHPLLLAAGQLVRRALA
jgi:hypothetical protein